MEKIIKITSSKNDQIKKIMKLRNKNKRDKYQKFLIEGYREILIASENEICFDSLFICPKLFLKNNEQKLIDKFLDKNINVYDCSEDVFRKISYRDRPDGLLAIANHFTKDLKALKKIISNKKTPFLIICEGIEKPGNLGTILRTADAANVDAVIVVDPMTDIFNPNVVRASVGALFTTKVFTVSSDEAINFLKKNNILIIAATPSADINYINVDLKKPLALAFGTEQLGLSDKWMKNSDILVKIPMLGKIDSLNVAASTTILIYETLRQRKLI